ncbi:MAG: erfK [Francisellaceae bacterium]|nr:erfK [Francisellaceae bacterium]
MRIEMILLKFINKWGLIFISLVLSTNAYSVNLSSNTPPIIDYIKEYAESLKVKPSAYYIVVSSEKQTLTLFKNEKPIKKYIISTSKYGLGQLAHSYKTPIGLHRIIEKIGHEVPHYGIFKTRQYLGIVWQKRPRNSHDKDYVSTRILRLEGLEPGLNKGKDYKGRNIDTKDRVVYIHGTTMEWKLGKPSTKGCIHMKAKDIEDLFNLVPNGALVWII